MFESIINFFKKIGKQDKNQVHSKDAAKERLHLVLMQDRANVSADFLDLMKQEIIEVIKKYIDVDESEIDVRLANKTNEDGTTGAPALYANIPIKSIKEDAKKSVGTSANVSEEKINEDKKEKEVKSTAHLEEKKDDNKEEIKQEENVNTDKEENIQEKKEENEKSQDNKETDADSQETNNDDAKNNL